MPICFTDSQIALCWIKEEEKEWKQFVENWVTEIRRLVQAKCWRHCASIENPADIPSRVITPAELQEKLNFCLCGPNWLVSDEGDMSAVGSDILRTCLQEMWSKERALMSLLASTGPTDITGIAKYSCLRRLLKVTTQVLKFVKIFKSRVQAVYGVSAEHMKLVLMHLVQVSQAVLQEKRKFRVWRRQFNLFTDATGVWMCRGWLANVPLSARFLILLDKEEALTRLIVIDCHERIKQRGVISTLTELRSSYWVVHGRKLVKKLLHNCVVCRRFQYKPL